LSGVGGNGWEQDASRSDAQPASESGGLVQRQTLAYRDDARGGNGGYPASISLTTLKLTPSPGEAQLRDILRKQVQQSAEQQGIALGDQVREGSRTLADGHGSLWFQFTGTVTGDGPLFTTEDATAKILGEVWNCPESGTSVAAVGLAQTTSTQVVGGIPVATNENPTNWREIAGDPSGSIDGQRDASALVYNVVCKA
jgi:hypothetical protein